MASILDNKLFEAFANASENIYVYVTDMASNITRWSQNAVDFFGLDDEYMYDTLHNWIEYVHTDDRHIYLEDIMAVANGQKAQHNCQYRVRNRYGEYSWVECKGSAILDDNGNLSVFAGIMTRIDNQNKYDALTHLLTGFELSRKNFEEDGTLMLIGIDSFRAINNQFGIAYGNKVLKYLSEVLLLRAGGRTVYRYHGDEFVIYGENSSVDDMIAVFENVHTICSSSESRSAMIDFNLSAGIVEVKRGDYALDIVERAEVSLSFAKKDKISHTAVYSSDIELKRKRRNLVSEELLKCIEDNFKGFYMVFQPILANEGDTVIACESLVRWQTDNEAVGECYPDEFISILESNGGIRELGYYVMEEAIRHAGIWQKKYKRFNVGFNVSYLQLEDPSFVPAVIEAVKKYDVDPSGIVVELTESILSADTYMIKNSFSILKDYGIKIALDDFGTGNSSFWMLHNIDVDIVKLDQTFIRGLDDTGTGIDYAIVESVGLMCNRIGCQTVAEGVETETIWNLISKFGFSGLQGYLFSRPVAHSEFEELLDKYNMKS